MSDQSRRKALRAEYAEAPPAAGVYRIVNRANGKALLGASANLPSVGNRLAFAQATNLPGALDPRLQDDIRAHGLAALAFAIIETLPITPTMSRAAITDELATLLTLCLEQYAPETLY